MQCLNHQPPFGGLIWIEYGRFEEKNDVQFLPFWGCVPHCGGRLHSCSWSKWQLPEQRDRYQCELLPPIPTTWHTYHLQGRGQGGKSIPLPKKFHRSAQSRQTWGMSAFWKKIQQGKLVNTINIYITNMLVEAECMSTCGKYLLCIKYIKISGT